MCEENVMKEFGYFLGLNTWMMLNNQLIRLEYYEWQDFLNFVSIVKATIVFGKISAFYSKLFMRYSLLVNKFILII